jgi:hypothetical protein
LARDFRVEEVGEEPFEGGDKGKSNGSSSITITFTLSLALYFELRIRVGLLGAHAVECQILRSSVS